MSFFCMYRSVNMTVSRTRTSSNFVPGGKEAKCALVKYYINRLFTFFLYFNRLVCDASERLGKNGAIDFRDHKFFAGIDWDTLSRSVPPYQPEFSSPTDTSNFDCDDMDVKPTSMQDQAPPPRSSHSAFSGNHLPFIGFTYTSNT